MKFNESRYRSLFLLFFFAITFNASVAHAGLTTACEKALSWLGSTSAARVAEKNLDSGDTLRPINDEKTLVTAHEPMSGLPQPGQVRRESVSSGGMGEIVKEFWPGVDFPLAVKRAKDSKSESALNNEGKVLTTLSKSNPPETIQKIYLHVEEKGKNVVASEFIEGKNMNDLYEKGKPATEFIPGTVEVLNQVEQLLTTLKWLHAQGFVHRDIKGNNILVKADGTIKLVDFGLATRFDENGIANGPRGYTWGYSAPEVLTKFADHAEWEKKIRQPPVLNDEPIGPLADVYSVGRILEHFVSEQRKSPFLLTKQMEEALDKIESHLVRPMTRHSTDWRIGVDEAVSELQNLRDEIRDIPYPASSLPQP